MPSSPQRLVPAAFGGGLLMALTLPPWGWWPLGAAGAAVVYSTLIAQPARWRLVLGLMAGLGLFVPGLIWVTEFTVPGFFVLAIVESAILAVAIAAVAPAAAAWTFPAALVVAEAVRSSWPLGGLPLGGIALGQVGGPLAPAARLGGHLLLVGLVGAAGVAAAHLARLIVARASRKASRGGWLAGIVAASVVVGTAALGAVAPMGRHERSLRVAGVQGGGDRGLRAVDSDPGSVFAAHLAASDLVKPPVDLVLWPEDVVDVDDPLAGSAEEAALSALARRLQVTLVVGVVEDIGGVHFRNAAVAWAPDGSKVARYDKVHRVPFGEYVPWRGFFERLADLSDVPRDAIAGKGPGRLRTPAGNFGVLVSYEVFFSSRARAAVDSGGTVLLVPTNASSYRRSQVPGQELAAARLRALESGRWVVQAAPTGYTAVVDHLGRVHGRTVLGRRAVLTRTVGLRTGRTLATRVGDWPVAALAGASLAGGWAITVARRRTTRAGAGLTGET